MARDVRSLKRIFKVLFLSFFMAQICLPAFTAVEANDKKKEELRRKLLELRRKKEEIAKKRAKDLERRGTPGGATLDETIARYERLNEKCVGKKNARCADILYTLGKLYYDKSRDDYIKAREAYERAMDRWERNPRGPEPVNPVPDYSKPLATYRRAVQLYPDFEKADEAYYQIGTIFLVTGELDKSRDAFEELIAKMPNSVRASAAHFRVADFCFMEHDYTCALRHLEKIDFSLVNLEIKELAHYRKAEIYYNRAEFDKAAELFFEYVVRCDAGEYLKKELRNEALEYMAISFSDMPNGAEEAIKFFRKKGRRSFEDYIIYTVGMKNFEHGQYDQAAMALQTALKSHPYYKEAPTAQQMVVSCYVIRKKFDEANRGREKLVDSYWKGSEWYSRNGDDPAAAEIAEREVKRALGAIPVWYHAQAQKTKRKQDFEKALRRYNEYFQKFPDDKWKVYEFKYNVAEIYNELKMYEKAAECYDYVAQADLSTFPEYQHEVDTFAMDKEELERQRKEGQHKSSPVSISQEDAGYNAVVALDNLRKKVMAERGITDEQAYALPETKKLLKYIDNFRRKFPRNSNSAELLYLAGNIHYMAKAHQEAIAAFRDIVDTYPGSKIKPKALRMLANSYSSAGEYALALQKYRELLAAEKPGTAGYSEVLDLAAGALFKKANDRRKSGDMMGAAEEFKGIQAEFPQSKVADRAWFEAGVVYEEAGSMALAAATFAELGDKFPKSPLREKAYVRAAEAYKKEKKFEDAARVYELAALKVKKPDYAIPSLSSAAESYQEVKMYGRAGKMSESIAERYPADSRTPLALYNAGLIYEKGKLYTDAIRVYSRLSTKYPQSEYAAEGAYSIGFCYEKMGKKEQMANSFTEFAQKFTVNKSKQVMAFVRAAEAYNAMNKPTLAEKNAEAATELYEKYRRKHDIDLVAASKAYYMLGEIKQKEFNAISLRARRERDVRKKLTEKTQALEPMLKAYAKAIELGVGEWTIRSTYQIGNAYVQFAEAYKNQSLFGSADQKVASRIKIVSGLEKYYLKAQEKFAWNLQTAYEQNIQTKWVDKSREEFMRMAYLKGDLFEEVGRIFVSAKCPRGMPAQECQVYREVLEEKQLEAQDAAVPKYEEAMRAAAEFGITQSKWLDSVRSRLKFLRPESEALQMQIVERKPKQLEPAPGTGKTMEYKDKSGKTRTVEVRRSSQAQARLKRNLARIQNIMEMNIPLEDKLVQLRSIESDARRAMRREEEQISSLRSKLAAK